MLCCVKVLYTKAYSSQKASSILLKHLALIRLVGLLLYNNAQGQDEGTSGKKKSGPPHTPLNGNAHPFSVMLELKIRKGDFSEIKRVK